MTFGISQIKSAWTWIYDVDICKIRRVNRKTSSKREKKWIQAEN